MNRVFVVCCFFLLTFDVSLGLLPSDAPSLELTGNLIQVSTPQELIDACWNLNSGDTIVLQEGTYDLTSITSPPNGIDRRLNIGRFSTPAVSNVAVRGATGDPTDVVIVGAGQEETKDCATYGGAGGLCFNTPFGIQVFNATDVLIADLTIKDVALHALQIDNGQGATRIRIYHCILLDAGQQVIKANRGSGNGAEACIVEYSVVGYTTDAKLNPDDPTYCYTNGIDVVGGINWIIRDNIIQNVRCNDPSELAGPAILMWKAGGGTCGAVSCSTGTIVERNTLIGCSRGISYGLSRQDDHTGGRIVNNMIRMMDDSSPYQTDVAIYITGDSQVVHNTVVKPNSYNFALEARYGATVVESINNVFEGSTWERDGATINSNDDYNLVSPYTNVFVDEASGDLHLTSEEVVPTASRISLVMMDFDVGDRSSSTNVGADEYGSAGDPGNSSDVDDGGDGDGSNALNSITTSLQHTFWL